jgi:lipopolysaccharide transport system ATP-binding protein
MYVRLAFAVAAHLEPEILVVDEVLAVGDAEFQKKCLGKMGTIAESGRTILFVSHNAQAISALCERCLWLDNKRVAMDGPAAEVLHAYARPGHEHDLTEIIAGLPPDELFRLHGVRLSQNGAPAGQRVEAGAPLTIAIEYEVFKPALGLRVLFQICDELENALLQGFHDEHEPVLKAIEPGRYLSTAVIPANLLAPIDYAIRIQAGLHHGRPVMPLDAVVLRVAAERVYNGPAEYSGLAFPAKLAPPVAWRTEAMGA